MSSKKKKHIDKKHLKTDHGCFSGLVTLRIRSLIGLFFLKDWRNLHHTIGTQYIPGPWYNLTSIFGLQFVAWGYMSLKKQGCFW